ncbi:MAG: hypothetical protein AAF206_07880, partial [Bacteroidota bacterium]
TGSSSSTYTLMNFSNGDRIYIKLELKGSNKQINYYVKNKTKNVSKSKTITVGNSWDNSGVKDKYYFKTGAYQQVSSSGSRPRVSLSRYELSFEKNPS